MKFLALIFTVIFIFKFTIQIKNKKHKNNPQMFRLKKMKELQSKHQWNPSINERMSDSFDAKIYSKGIKNADGFISYLGFLRDSSNEVNTKIFKKLSEKFLR